MSVVEQAAQPVNSQTRSDWAVSLRDVRTQRGTPWGLVGWNARVATANRRGDGDRAAFKYHVKMRGVFRCKLGHRSSGDGRLKVGWEELSHVEKYACSLVRPDTHLVITRSSAEQDSHGDPQQEEDRSPGVFGGSFRNSPPFPTAQGGCLNAASAAASEEGGFRCPFRMEVCVCFRGSLAAF
ncbi:hypothetical protein AOLI_G00144970 [Acnodon oligacanthus]